MSIIKTSQLSVQTSVPSRLPDRSRSVVSPSSGMDTSNLSPGAAARFEKLIRSIDNFTAAVQSKAITLPERK